jgi:hypothetical protein
MAFLLFPFAEAHAQLQVITPSSPQPITHIQISPGAQKLLEKPKGAIDPYLRLEGVVDSRGTMTVGLREERVGQGSCRNCISGRVQEWKPDQQGVSHFVNPKGLNLAPASSVNLMCRQDDRPGRLICEIR